MDKDKEDRNAGWILAMVYVGLLPIVVSIVAFWPSVPLILRRLGTSEAASWSQAIGSVAAVFAAIHAATIPVRAEERRRRQERVDFINGVIDAIQISLIKNEAIYTAIHARDMIGFKNAVALISHNENATLMAFTELPVDRWPSSILYAHVGALLGYQSRFVEKCRSAVGDLHTEGRYWTWLDRSRRDVQEAENRALNSAGRLEP
jgi:hypothetical protein